MEAKFSDYAQKILSHAQDICLSQGHMVLRTEHFLLGVLEIPQSNAFYVLVSLNIHIQSLKEELHHRIEQLSKSPKQKRFKSQMNQVFLSDMLSNILKKSYLEANRLDSALVCSEHILLSYFREYPLKEDNFYNQPIALSEYNITQMIIEHKLPVEPAADINDIEVQEIGYTQSFF